MKIIIELAVISLMLFGCEGSKNTNFSVQQSPEIDAIAVKAIKEGFPGITIALIKPDGDILSGAAGYADRSTMQKMQPDDKVACSKHYQSIYRSSSVDTG